MTRNVALVFVLAGLCPAVALAGEAGEADTKVDTQFIFGFTAGAGVGEAGERELEHQTQGQWGKQGGQYAALSDQLRLEYSPFENFRFELGAPVSMFQIAGISGLDDRRQGAFNGLASEFRYRLLDGESTPFALTLGAEPHWNRTDEISGAPVDNLGGELTLALDRELVAGRLFAALNLVYDPEVEQSRVTALWQHESTTGIAASAVTQLSPGVFVGAEARYLRKYEGLGLDALVGQALFVGPNAYVKLSKTLAISGAWSTQVAGRATAVPGPLDLTSFTRQQALLRVEYNF
ncbi:MAG: hypothetical protein ACLP1D_24395 [Xanthobacteraceae bacterium]